MRNRAPANRMRRGRDRRLRSRLEDAEKRSSDLDGRSRRAGRPDPVGTRRSWCSRPRGAGRLPSIGCGTPPSRSGARRDAARERRVRGPGRHRGRRLFGRDFRRARDPVRSLVVDALLAEASDPSPCSAARRPRPSWSCCRVASCRSRRRWDVLDRHRRGRYRGRRGVATVRAIQRGEIDAVVRRRERGRPEGAAARLGRPPVSSAGREHARRRTSRCRPRATCSTRTRASPRCSGSCPPSGRPAAGGLSSMPEPRSARRAARRTSRRGVRVPRSRSSEPNGGSFQRCSRRYRVRRVRALVAHHRPHDAVAASTRPGRHCARSVAARSPRSSSSAAREGGADAHGRAPSLSPDGGAHAARRRDALRSAATSYTRTGRLPTCWPPAAALIGRRFADFVGGRRRRAARCVDRVRPGAATQAELSFCERTAGASRARVHRALPEEGGVCLIVTDLTAQKAYEAMINAQALERSILEQAVDAIVVCDPGGRVIRASRAALELCGRNPFCCVRRGLSTRGRARRADLEAVMAAVVLCTARSTS